MIEDGQKQADVIAVHGLRLVIGAIQQHNLLQLLYNQTKLKNG
jgi:hypothetical protein